MTNEQIDCVIADIRNKLTPISNLIAMLEDSKLLYHHDEEIHKIIEQEIVNSKNSIQYITDRLFNFKAK